MVYCEIASTGQDETQAPQSIHVPSSHTDLESSFIDRAPTGQTPTQAPQPMHVSELIVTGIINPPFLFHFIIP